MSEITEQGLVRLPELDQPWHRLPAIVGVSLVIWCGVLVAFGLFLELAGSASFSGTDRSAPRRPAYKRIPGGRRRQSRRRPRLTRAKDRESDPGRQNETKDTACRATASTQNGN